MSGQAGRQHSLDPDVLDCLPDIRAVQVALTLSTRAGRLDGMIVEEACERLANRFSGRFPHRHSLGLGSRLETRLHHPPRPETPRPHTKDHCLMCSCNSVTETVIDVRQIMPRMRHPLIFGTFDQLGPGETFLLVSDHDPRPLFYQFNVERPGEFGWDYQEEGPDLWRVRISRTA